MTGSKRYGRRGGRRGRGLPKVEVNETTDVDEVREHIERLRKELYKGEPKYEQNPELHRKLDTLINQFHRLQSRTQHSS